MWSIMTLFSLAIAGYAVMIVMAPDLRPPYVRSLIVARPFAAIAHFLGGAIALAAGAFQFNTWIRTRHIAAHRWTGRVYLCAIAASGFAGLYMTLHSPAGLVAQAGFGLLALAWLFSTFKAYMYIRRREVRAHQDWMIRSYALTLAAVTLRLYLPSSQMAGFSMAIAYPAIAWLCWVPNLLIAEWIVRTRSGGAPVHVAAQA